MSANKAKSLDYKPLSSVSKENGAGSGGAPDTLKPLESLKKEKSGSVPSLENPDKQAEKKAALDAAPFATENFDAAPVFQKIEDPSEPLSYAEEQKQKRRRKSIEKDKRLLGGDHWLARNGHTLTYVGIF